MKTAARIAWRVLATSLVVCLHFSACEAGRPSGAAGRQPERPNRGARPAGPREAQPSASRAAAPPSNSSRLEVVPGAGGAKTVAMEFYGLDIDHLLRLLSHAAQVPIIKSDQVTGPVTIIAPEPVPLDVAFQMLNSILEVRGYTMVLTELGIYKVLPMAEAIQSGIPLKFGAQVDEYPPGDELLTQIIPLENVDGNDLAAQLQPLLSPHASIIPTSTNCLIITDTAANVARALRLIDDAESQLAGGFRVFPLQYYSATDMAELVTNIVLSRGGVAGRAGPRPAWERRVARRAAPAGRPPARPTPQPAAAAGPEFAYPDERTNSLIVLATPIHLRQIEELIIQLDHPVSLRDTYFVYPVQNLVASELAELLAPLIGAEVVKGPEIGAPAGRERRPPTAGRQQGQPYQSPFSDRRSLGARTSGPTGRRLDRRTSADFELEPLAGESSAYRRTGPILLAQAQEGAVQVAPQPERPAEPAGEPVPPEVPYEEPTALTGAGVAEAMIAADDNTNTLLISAPPEQIDLVQQMLEKLDVLPPQVHIRAIIAEVLLTRETSLGFQWQSLGRTWGIWKDETYKGDIGTGFGLSTPTDESVPTGFFATITDTEFQAVLNALTTDSDSRVLAAPSIFTTNNQEAEINISEQIPVPTGTFQSTIGAETISTSIRYESVGIVLTVTPTVTQGDMVRFVVSITANDVGADVVVGGQSYPSILNRSADAVLNVRDGDTVVLGGLMRDGVIESASRVPILGDLPLVGALFRSTTSTNVKTELLVFLTPHIVRTPGDAARLTESEKLRLPTIPRSLRKEPTGVEEPTYWPPDVEALEPETPGSQAVEEEPAAPEEETVETAPPAEEQIEEPAPDLGEEAPLPAEGVEPQEPSPAEPSPQPPPETDT